MRKQVSLTACFTAMFGLVAPEISIAGSIRNAGKLEKINHFVVIYEENHSFDNLYGSWEGVNGLSNATPAHKLQVNQQGSPFRCLLQNDVNLTSPPLPGSCTDTIPVSKNTFSSAFINQPFVIDDYIAASDTTCPQGAQIVLNHNGVLKGSGLPGGCTQDIVHRFYQEQYQLNGGKQNRYVTGSDAVGLTVGHYHTQNLPIYRYLHQPNHPKYAIADNFFQAAFGGSFLNHQWLITARTPTFTNAVTDGSANDLHSIVDQNGMPNQYPLYTPTGVVKDNPLTVVCPSAIAGLACGDYAVNTMQPTYQPYSPGTADPRKLPPQTTPTIGDRLSAAKVSWAWYSGGWSNANGDVGSPGWTNGENGRTCTDSNVFPKATYPNCPDKLFQFHHQPFNYYANYAPGTAARKEHLRDEQEFIKETKSSTKECKLKTVSFVKPIGEENEHPGYASQHNGDNHLVELIDSIEKSACAKDTVIIVTYDEFGGQWDHVSPPGQGNNNGPHDQWEPGTRIPALIISPLLKSNFVVDHQSYDTTSIVATLEHRFGLQPLNERDAKVNDLSHVFSVK